MVDHRRTLGESGRGYPCYVLKPPKIALIVVSGTPSPAAIDGFSGAWPSTHFQVHCLLYRGGNKHMAWTIGQWLQCCTSHVRHLPQLNIVLWVCQACKQFVPFSCFNWCLMHKPTGIILWTVNYCFRKLIINHL